MRLLLAICLFAISAYCVAQTATAPAKPVAQISWDKLPADQKMVLAPLQVDWDMIDGLQQQRYIVTAKMYAKMQPIQKERFQERISAWAKLTLDQRVAARAKYQSLAKLPPAKQHAIKERWLEKQANAKAESPVAPAATTPPAANSLR